MTVDVVQFGIPRASGDLPFALDGEFIIIIIIIYPKRRQAMATLVTRGSRSLSMLL